jgi:signal transduction histidine kinase
MLNGLRTQLTSWFLGLFLLLYFAGGALALIVFNSVLTSQLDEDLRELTSELRPSIEFSLDSPSLKHWAEHLANYHHIFLPTIQLYDNNGTLLEEYGPPGIKRLSTGDLSDTNDKTPIKVRSSNKKLYADENHQDGYLQVQVSTKRRNEAIFKLGRNLVLLAPLFAIGIWFAGYFFSAKAIQPLGQTLDLLRRFVADAGHEFNTPITVIEASVQTLEHMVQEFRKAKAESQPDSFRPRPIDKLAGVQAPANSAVGSEPGIKGGLSSAEDDARAFADVLEGISRASTRMKDLAANLMLLARMENPELISHMAPVPVSEILEPMVKEFIALAAQKEIKILYESAPSIVAIGNADSLRTMLSNLLDNALRYTEKGGSITVNVSSQDNNIVFTVQDTGIGIPSDSIGHIFERFYRVDKSRSRSQGGSGLGLSIVKAIVDAHKGLIKAESQLGQGTKFTVVLPTRI